MSEQTMKASVCTEPGQHVALVRTNTKQMNSFQKDKKIHTSIKHNSKNKIDK